MKKNILQYVTQIFSIVFIGLVACFLSTTMRAQEIGLAKAEKAMDSNRSSEKTPKISSSESKSYADAETDESELFIREMKPVFTSTRSTFYVILHEAAVLEIRLFDSRGAAISAMQKKSFESGCVILEIPITMPEDKEIVCCVKVNGKKYMKTFHL
ncbi:MAG: hypothetical protein U0264_04770 [Candidatus Kapaibacterium sp.]